MSKATVIVIVSFVVPALLMVGWAVWYTLRDTEKRIPSPEWWWAQVRAEGMIRHGMDPNLSMEANLYHDAYIRETGCAWIEADPPSWRWPVWDDYRHGSATPASRKAQSVGRL